MKKKTTVCYDDSQWILIYKPVFWGYKSVGFLLLFCNFRITIEINTQDADS